jgi:hypothetical protein
MKDISDDWSYTMEYDQTLGPALFEGGNVVLSAMEWETEPTEAIMKLAAQAPAMARLLLKVLDDGRYPNAQFDEGEIHRVLRAAGVLP